MSKWGALPYWQAQATPQDKTGPDLIVVHETLEGAPYGVNAGFADGHVEFMPLGAFQKALAKQKAAR